MAKKIIKSEKKEIKIELGRTIPILPNKPTIFKTGNNPSDKPKPKKSN